MQEIKVGDKARVIDGNEYHGFEIGSVVTIIEDDGSHIPYRCRDEKGTTRWMVADHLAPLEPAPPTAPAPTIPDEIEINGETYRRVAKEVKPEAQPAPACGQIWRDAAGDIVCIAQVGRRKYQAVSLNRPHTFWGEPKDAPDCVRDGARSESWEYIAPSLADALERGLITAADLR